MIRNRIAAVTALVAFFGGTASWAADPPAKGSATPTPPPKAPTTSAPAPIDIHKMHMVLEVHDTAGALLSTVDFPDYSAQGMFTVSADNNHTIAATDDTVAGYKLDGHVVVTVRDAGRTAIKITGEHIVIRRTVDVDVPTATPATAKPSGK